MDQGGRLSSRVDWAGNPPAVPGLHIQGHPKSIAGRRRLSLPKFVVGMLLARQLAVVEANDHDVVFPSAVGSLREQTTVHRQWRGARKRAGFDWVTFHSFRKTVATVIGLGSLQDAADQMGHSGTTVTERGLI